MAVNEVTIAVKLTDEQNEVVRGIMKFPKQVQSLGGYAGTGKSVVAAELKKRLPNFKVCAFTGKAASVLRKKGVNGATTIHSLIYKVIESDYWDEEVEKWKIRLSWERRGKQFLRDVGCEGFIVDESSMVGKDIDTDLRSFDLPIIYIGDHGQLPPVMSGVLNTMANPDYKLETIHRNANEVARFAEFLRLGNHCTNWEPEDRVILVPREYDKPWHALLPDSAYEADQIICAFNVCRVAFNKAARHRLGFPPERPVVGDRIMCLKNNNKGVAIYNGMQGTISAIDEETRRLTFTVDGIGYEVTYDPSSFNCQDHRSLLQERIGWVPFDYAYAVTCHKYQGDECDFVTVVEQRCSAWDHRRWAYTAASRAKEKLLWIH